jgi:hypothetical protein
LPPGDAVAGEYCSEACWDADDGPACSHCDGPRDPRASVEGSWCSLECYRIEKGENALAAVEQNHRFCATCFRQKKTVYRPTDEALLDADVAKGIVSIFKGFQDPTEHATLAERSEVAGSPFTPERDDSDQPDLRSTSPDRIRERRALGCVCGNVEHDARVEVLANVDLSATIYHLALTMRKLDQADNVGGYFELDRFGDVFDPDEGNWAEAIGAAIYS